MPKTTTIYAVACLSALCLSPWSLGCRGSTSDRGASSEAAAGGSDNAAGPGAATAANTIAGGNTETPAQPGNPTAGGNTVLVPTQPVFAVKAVAFPTLDFVRAPGGPAAKQVALTFDDGPDGSGGSAEGKAGRSNTSYVLDQLKSLNLKGTFFLCSNKATTLIGDAQAIADVKRMVAEGHHLANHSAQHERFSATATSSTAAMTPQAAADQLQQVQDALGNAKVLGSQAPQLTMYRLPYGVPYQGSTTPLGSDQADIKVFAPVTAKWGVHVGWGIDTHDWECANSATPDRACVMTHLNRFIADGSAGVILMHATALLSAEVLPEVVSTLKAAGYTFVMVEDFIKAKYGGTSAELAAAAKTAKFSDADLIDAAAKSSLNSEWVKGINPD